MAGTRKAHVATPAQLRLINEWRQIDMTDADWYRKNNIGGSHIDRFPLLFYPLLNLKIYKPIFLISIAD